MARSLDFSRWGVLLLTVLLICQVGGAYAQRITIIDDEGDTVVGITTTDRHGDPSTRRLYTITAVSPSPSPNASPLAMTSPVPTVATAQVAEGRIMDYSSYASSVSADASSRTAAALSGYLATASAFGIKQGAEVGMVKSGASRSISAIGFAGALGLGALLTAFGCRMGLL